MASESRRSKVPWRSSLPWCSRIALKSTWSWQPSETRRSRRSRTTHGAGKTPGSRSAGKAGMTGVACGSETTSWTCRTREASRTWRTCSAEIALNTGWTCTTTRRCYCTEPRRRRGCITILMKAAATTNSWPSLCQILPDFLKFFSRRFLGKFVVNWLLKIPPLLAYVPHCLVKH